MWLNMLESVVKLHHTQFAPNNKSDWSENYHKNGSLACKSIPSEVGNRLFAKSSSGSVAYKLGAICLAPFLGVTTFGFKNGVGD